MFIPEWLLAVAITMFVIDIFLPTEILSWISLLMISVYVVWKIDPPILWGILIFIITFSSVTIFYYLFLRRFISPIVSKTIVRNSPKQKLSSIVGEKVIIENVKGINMVKCCGELWPIASTSPLLKAGTVVIVENVFEGQLVVRPQ